MGSACTIGCIVKKPNHPCTCNYRTFIGRKSSDKLAKALSALGRIIKSIYIIRYLSDPNLRYLVHLQLNRGESRHGLARHLFFYNRGIFKTSAYEELMNKASCLSLLSNAVLVWNTEQIEKMIKEFASQGYQVDTDDLARISPLWFKNIIAHGTYKFTDLDK